MKRRELLRAVAAGSLGAVGLSSSATAVHDSSGQPSHVTLSYDESELETYRPKLVTGHLDTRPSLQYAWIAESTEHDDDAYCYWTYYVTQQGFTDQDSHYLDREPLYVFVDEAGDVSQVIYSGYHWLAADTHVPNTVEADDDGQHPTFRVAKKYHHYLQTTDDSGELVDLSDLNDQFDTWLANGWEDDLCVGCAQDPWLMRRRSSWWKDDRSGSLGELFAKIYLRASKLPGVNIRGGANTDL
jgi:hypothetical protein